MEEMGRGIGKVSIIGTGSYVPERVLSNADLEKMVDTSDEWISVRTGMKERRLAAEGEYTSNMAAAAARAAIADAGLSAPDIEVIIVATISPDMMFPATACLVQNEIGASHAFCFDLEAACSGFIYAMETARGLLASGLYKNALVIGAEKMSSIVDWEDRATCVLFGDGAGAVVLQAGGEGRGIISSYTCSDGSLGDLLMMEAGGSRKPASRETVDQRLHYLKMGGNAVFKHAVRCMMDAGERALEKAGLTIADVDMVIPHQANIRIISAIAEKIGVSMDKVFVNLDKYGNTTAATIPLALDEAIKTGRVKKGNLVLFVSFGAGFTWGAILVEI